MKIPNASNMPLGHTASPCPENSTPESELTGIGRLIDGANRGKSARKVAYFIAAVAVISGIATAVAMTGARYNLQLVLYLLYVDLVLLFVLAGLVMTKIYSFWKERRRTDSGAGLHTQLVLTFSLIAVTPAVLVAIFAAVFLNVGLQGWFSDKVKAAVEDSAVVAAAYLSEHQQSIRSDAFAMANDLNRQVAALSINSRQFNRFLTAQSRIRGIPEAIVADSNRQILARSQFSQSLEFDLAPDWAFEQAANGEIVVLTSDQDDRVRAVVRLGRFVDAYLLVGRFVDPRVIDHVEKVNRGVAQYQDIEKKRGGIQITFVLLFVVVALMMLLAAAWVGLMLATQFATPISSLVAAAERVRGGDLTVHVPEDSNLNEVDTLIRAFNRMTAQLGSQQEGLMEANLQLDERRRFTETVLAGVSSGVIGLDQNGCIDLPNRSASVLLQVDLREKEGQSLASIVPEMQDLLNATIKRPERLQQSEIRIERKEHTYTLLVRITAEQEQDGNVIGYVATFDDITALQSAQRQAAWADVARRIAHEIKNPLTPIQLSAERLKRKYLKQIKEDPETFKICTETIIRQVGDIGRMVDEFSSFARLPEPSIRAENLSTICHETVFLERNRSGDVTVTFEAPEADVLLRCDRQQLNQALTNLIKNAVESVTERLADDPAKDKAEPGRVVVHLEEGISGDNRHDVRVVIEDNGKGLPRKNRNRLTEPYVTNRERGTGLGLAIVKKIVEDHEGQLLLEDAQGGGARVTMVFHPDMEAVASDDIIATNASKN